MIDLSYMFAILSTAKMRSGLYTHNSVTSGFVDCSRWSGILAGHLARLFSNKAGKSNPPPPHEQVGIVLSARLQCLASCTSLSIHDSAYLLMLLAFRDLSKERG